MSKKPLYITTTLPYVNADPHIGFALELVQADVLTRWNLQGGRDVFFNTGTDEHGTKIFRKSAEEGKEVKAYVDKYAEKFKGLKDLLGIHPSLHFIRTTEEKHIKAAKEMWTRCFENGDIYKKKYKGLYCVADEAFLREADLVDGHCPNHPTLELQEIEEENYFFKFSNYKEKLKEYLKEGTVVPEWRRTEALKVVEEMEDFSISREKSRLPWGISVPNDDSQVMYVWFDALTSYISTLGWPDGNDFDKFWTNGETLQLAGKDQVKFQSVIWQAMLLSAREKNTDQIFYHGFINSGGQKMSKSLGNVIEPSDLVQKYSVDATRYLLLRHVHPFEDTDITWEKLDEWYEADLANGLGNFVSRIMKMSETYLSGPVDTTTNDLDSFAEKINEFKFQEALGLIFAAIGLLDLEIQNKKPFQLIKDNPEEAKQIITKLVQELSAIGRNLSLFMPETSEKILTAIKANKKPENLFPRHA